jgi:hypothetical protein
MDMNSKLNHPTVILGALGAASGFLGTFGLGVGFGEAPHPGAHMILAGVWFGLVIGYGVWKWGNRSRAAAAIAFIGTWVAWELAVNLALQLDSNWLKATTIPETLRMHVSGFLAGALGAVVTWAGAACRTPKLAQLSTALVFASIGALFGLLLPLTNNYDSPAVLLLPWETAIAAMLGASLTLRKDSGGSAIPPCPHSPAV